MCLEQLVINNNERKTLKPRNVKLLCPYYMPVNGGVDLNTDFLVKIEFSFAVSHYLFSIA